MATVEQCKRSLTCYKGHITRAINNCADVITAGDVNVDRLETSISFLESKWPAYENAYMNWEATLLSKDSEHDVSSVQRDYYAVWKDYQDNLVKFKSLLRNNRDQK